MKHAPSKSIYIRDVEIVEEKRSGVRLFPHTEQLPVISRAATLEFYGDLPPRLANADHRAGDSLKYTLFYSVVDYSFYWTALRRDCCRIFPFLDPHLVAKPAVLQQVSEPSPQGSSHSFRLFHGDDFLPDIYLSGKRVRFSSHVLDRFSSRVSHCLGIDLIEFLCTSFSQPIVVMKTNRKGNAAVLMYEGAVLALTFKEDDAGFFFTTCLTAKELANLEPINPPEVLNFHYGCGFKKPTDRNWDVSARISNLVESWSKRVPFPSDESVIAAAPALSRKSWADFVRMKPAVLVAGSRMVFIDDIHGPGFVVIHANRRDT